MSTQPEELLKTLAHHDAAIGGLSGRMTGVETGLRTLQGEVHSGFNALSSKLDKIDAQPKFNFHETTRTVFTLICLLGVMVSAVIWIVNGQFSGMIAEQKALNTSVIERLKDHRSAIELLGSRTDDLKDRTQWLPTTPTRK